MYKLRLIKLGVPATTRGLTYLNMALELWGPVVSLTKLYANIANRFGTTNTRVADAMRYPISFCPGDNKTLSNKAFLAKHYILWGTTDAGQSRMPEQPSVPPSILDDVKIGSFNDQHRWRLVAANKIICSKCRYGTPGMTSCVWHCSANKTADGNLFKGICSHFSYTGSTNKCWTCLKVHTMQCDDTVLTELDECGFIMKCTQYVPEVNLQCDNT